MIMQNGSLEKVRVLQIARHLSSMVGIQGVDYGACSLLETPLCVVPISVSSFHRGSNLFSIRICLMIKSCLL